jgi:hypothetical protein
VHLPSSADMFAMSERPWPSPLSLAIKELWLAAPVGFTVEKLKSATDPPYPSDFVLDLFYGLSENRSDVKNSSYSGKTHSEVKAACVGFVTKAMSVDKKK